MLLDLTSDIIDYVHVYRVYGYIYVLFSACAVVIYVLMVPIHIFL